VSAFDDQDTDQKTTEHPAKRIALKAIELAKAHPFPAAAVGAFVAFGIFAFVAALFGPTPPPAPPAIAVPSTPVPAVVPPAGSAPPPAAAIGATTTPPPAAPAVAGPVVLPASLPIDAAVERRALAAVDMDTDTQEFDNVSTWVPLAEEALPATDAVAALNFAGMADRFAAVWPGRNKTARVHVSGLAKIENAGQTVVILTVQERGSCNAEFGPVGNKIASAELRNMAGTQEVAPSVLNLEPGFYQVRLSCAVRFWRNQRTGSATLAVRGEGGQAKVIELYQPAAEPTPAPEAPVEAAEATP
jgi:hypothetical protein